MNAWTYKQWDERWCEGVWSVAADRVRRGVQMAATDQGSEVRQRTPSGGQVGGAGIGYGANPSAPVRGLEREKQSMRVS